MGILDEARAAVELASKADNIDLYRQILDLQAEVQGLVQENREAEERIRELEAALEFDGELAFDQGVYWREIEESGRRIGPFCSRCWDSENQATRLHQPGDGSYKCPECGTVVRHPEADGGAPAPIGV